MHGNEDSLAGRWLRPIAEKELAVESGLASLRAKGWPCANPAENPPLELVRVGLRQPTCLFQVDRLSPHIEVDAFEAIARTHDVDGQVRRVDADPAPLEPLGDCDGRAAPAEWIEHDVALVAACPYDALEKRLRLLCRKASAFSADSCDDADFPRVGKGHSVGCELTRFPKVRQRGTLGFGILDPRFSMARREVCALLLGPKRLERRFCELLVPEERVERVGARRARRIKEQHVVHSLK